MESFSCLFIHWLLWMKWRLSVFFPWFVVPSTPWLTLFLQTALLSFSPEFHAGLEKSLKWNYHPRPCCYVKCWWGGDYSMIIINGSYTDSGLVSQLPVIFIQGSQTYYMGYMGNKQVFCFLSVSIYQHSRTLSRNYDLLQPWLYSHFALWLSVPFPSIPLRPPAVSKLPVLPLSSILKDSG